MVRYFKVRSNLNFGSLIISTIINEKKKISPRANVEVFFFLRFYFFFAQKILK